jgi:hypothetical protein
MSKNPIPSDFKKVNIAGGNLNSNALEMALVNLLTKLVNYFDEFTYYKRSEIIPLLLLSKNKYFRKILFGLGYSNTENLNLAKLRKYEKGIFKQEVMRTIESIAQIIINMSQNNNGMDESSGILSKLFNRH